MCTYYDPAANSTKDGTQRVTHKSRFSPGDVVYVRAIVTDLGTCGQPAVRISQPGGYAIVVPSEKEVFKGKSKTSTVITLEA